MSADLQSWADRYDALGLHPIPLHPRSKQPIGSWGVDHPWRLHSPHDNLGVIPGDTYADIDLDDPLARLAFGLLPQTSLIVRNGVITHLWYSLTSPGPYTRLADVVEIRTGDHHQTMVPPSTHPDGHTLRWYHNEDLDFTPIDFDTLHHAAATLAGLVLLARCAQPGSYHAATLAMAGFLAHRGIPESKAITTIRLLLDAQGSDGRDKVNIIRHTYELHSQGQPVAVWSHLEGYPPAEQARLIAPCATQSTPEDDFQDAPPDTPTLTLHDLIVPANKLPEPVPLPWVWDQWIPLGTVAVLAGPGGVSKSTFASQLAVHVALGQPLFGISTRKGRTLIISMEDNLNQLSLRLRAIASELGTSVDELGDSISVLDGTLLDMRLVRISTQGGLVVRRTKLLDMLIEECRNYDLVVLDLLFDFWDGSENNRAEVSAYLRQVLGKLASECGISVLGITHPSKAALRDGTFFAGSTAVAGSARAGLTMIEDHGVITLSLAKSNYGGVGMEVKLRRRQHWLEQIEEAAQADAADVAREQLVEPVLRAVEQCEDWTTLTDIWTMVSLRHDMSRMQVQECLAYLVETERADQQRDRQRRRWYRRVGFVSC